MAEAEAAPGDARTPRSLASRLVLGATVVLAFSLGAVGLILEAAVRDSFEESSRQRLQAQVYGLLAILDLSPDGDIQLPERTPEPRLNRPDSGLYAAVAGPGRSWQSASGLGENPALPEGELPPGETRFFKRLDIGPERAYVLRQGVAWDIGGTAARVVVTVAEHERAVEQQVSAFRATLWAWMAGALVVLLILQVAVLRWGLKPVRKLADALVSVRRGEAERIGGRYPRELTALRDAINGFITGERKHLTRYRNSLSDLAHSLKTPLTVLRSELEASAGAGHKLIEQVERMDESIAWQLKRAKATGPASVTQAVAVGAVAGRIIPALEKVNADRQVRAEAMIDIDAQFFGDAGDLMEILGNILDNAFKWARSEVCLRAERLETSSSSRPGLRLTVEDDGPGISADQVRSVLERGVRADERVSGHGLGLAIVADIVEAHGGTIELGRSDRGGAAVVVVFPEE